MAMCVSSIAKVSFNLLSKNVLKPLTIIATRQLYSPNAMGMSGYLNAREYVKSQFRNVDNLFFDKMKEFADKDSSSIIFTEDLKTILHLVENKPEDFELLYKMLIKYHSQNNLRFSNYVFGTVVMRTFYHLDAPDLALKAFKDPQLDGFFDQIMTFQLLMDLLYNHGKYAEVREVYNIVKIKNINGLVHPKNVFVLAIAACYKENTSESFEYAVNLFKEVQERGYELPRRSVAFFGILALKQNAPEVTLEVAALLRNARYIDVRSLKIEAFLALKRLDEILVYFRNSLQNQEGTNRKELFFKDTIEKVENFIKNENLDESHELVQTVKQLKLHDYIQPKTFEEHINTPIEYRINMKGDRPQDQNRYGRNVGQNSDVYGRFNNRRRFENERVSGMPGIRY